MKSNLFFLFYNLYCYLTLDEIRSTFPGIAESLFAFMTTAALTKVSFFSFLFYFYNTSKNHLHPHKSLVTFYDLICNLQEWRRRWNRSLCWAHARPASSPRYSPRCSPRRHSRCLPGACPSQAQARSCVMPPPRWPPSSLSADFLSTGFRCTCHKHIFWSLEREKKKNWQP